MAHINDAKNKSDESRKSTVNTPDNYDAIGKEVTEKDDLLDEATKEDIERKLNGHTLQVARALKLGVEKNEDRIFKMALTNMNIDAPTQCSC